MVKRRVKVNKKEIIENIKTHLYKLEDVCIFQMGADARAAVILAESILAWREVKRLE